MTARIIELWGMPRQSKSQKADAGSNHVPPEQERNCQIEIANNDWIKRTKRSLPRTKRGCQNVRFKFNLKLSAKALSAEEENCQIVRWKQILSTSIPCVWKNIFGMAACQNLLSSPSCELVCWFCQNMVIFGLKLNVCVVFSWSKPHISLDTNQILKP